MRRPPLRSCAAWSGFVLALGGLAVFFFGVEVPAVLNDVPADTFSEAVWWVRSLHPVAAVVVAVVSIAGGLVAGILALWLPVHFITAGKVDRPFVEWVRRRLGIKRGPRPGDADP